MEVDSEVPGIRLSNILYQPYNIGDNMPPPMKAYRSSDPIS